MSSKYITLYLLGLPTSSKIRWVGPFFTELLDCAILISEIDGALFFGPSHLWFDWDDPIQLGSAFWKIDYDFYIGWGRIDLVQKWHFSQLGECLLHLLMQDIWKKNYVAETHCFNWSLEFFVKFAIFLRNLVIVSNVKVLNLKSKSLNFNLKNICKQTLKSTFTILDSRYKKFTLQQIIIQIPSRYDTRPFDTLTKMPV